LSVALSSDRRVINSSSIGRNYLVAAGAGGLVLVASLVNLLRFHGYPLLAPEVAPIYLAMAAAAAAVGGFYLLVGRVWRPGLDALLVAVAVDLNSEGFMPIAVAAGAALLLAIVIRRSLLAPIAFMAAVALALVLVGLRGADAKTPTAGAAPVNTRPVIVHIILDEHVGIEGLPAENPASPALREELKAFYLDRGFRLYGRAYSEHMHTVNALPQLMNSGANQPAQANQMKKGVTLTANAYFDRLQSLGYRLSVYQNGFIELCAGRPGIDCVTYPYAGLHEVATSTLSTRDKASTIAFALIGLSDTALELVKRYDLYGVTLRRRGVPAPAIALDLRRQMTTVTGLAAAERLIADLETARPGQAYIAHLLLPHGPYATDADCDLRPRSAWAHRRSRQPIRQREAAYFDQVRCTTSLVGEALDALERSPAGRNAIVIVHGDHGSRITLADPMSWMRRVNDRDLIAVYSTLFAVRAPGVEPGYEDAPAALPDLFNGLVESGFSEAPAVASDKTIMLADQHWRPAKQASLPASW
jgi:hypothetical protein